MLPVVLAAALPLPQKGRFSLRPFWPVWPAVSDPANCEGHFESPSYVHSHQGALKQTQEDAKHLLT